MRDGKRYRSFYQSEIRDYCTSSVHNCTMKSPDWDHFRFFLALVDASTLTGAARALGVEHTTVARRIDTLESALKTRLFDRFPKGWALTSDGENMVPHARKLEADMHALMRATTGSTALDGIVRVSAPPAITTCLLAPRLQKALRHLPGIKIELLAESRLVDLTRREADIALRFQRPSSPGLAVRTIAVISYGLYAHRRYLKNLSPDAWEFLGYNDGLQDTPQQKWLDAIKGERRYRLRSNDLSVLFEAANAGEGVAVLPDYFESRSSSLIRIASPACPIKRKLWIVLHEDVRRTARVRAVADAIIALFDDNSRPS